MTTLYLCGAGNPEGVRLALNINRAQSRWDRIIVLDDDPSKHGQLILGVEIAGPFSMLGQPDPASAEVSNLVTRTTRGRQAALRKIQAYGLPFAPMIDPGVDITWVEFGQDITVYRNASFGANSTVDEGSVILGGANVGHGSRLGRCCIVAPGAVINARVELGDGVYVGTNASILPELKIGAWATIGANSAVVQDVSAGATVLGVPAQVLVPGSGDREPEASRDPGESRKTAKDSFARPGTEPRASERLGGALARLRSAQEEFVKSRRIGR